ncbi:alpha/beta hydrolase-fold protein [Brevibacillus nitrificans]|uniref:alpha/beta hydrolase n=1 Tax=Brevibacillus nitrificans TaxID=651560 RepID=UPI0028603A38|nr:alpha/beta hydrolase-fold protein [Brevibacillus nitrificans]MDR7316654.1 putative alpha/beta superfamily hydrolase [Brevibacillus nitrificans]
MKKKRIIIEEVAGFELHIYLPVHYLESNHRYPVVYVQDEGSVVLDSYNYVDHLFLTKQLPEIIFVGIKPHERNDEYSPWPTASLVPGGRNFGGGAKTYLQTLVDQIKPYIDQTYRTLPEKENTAITGCSLGGLVSIYAYYEHAEIFGKSALISASFWYDGFVEYIRSQALPTLDHRMYMYTGELEGIYKTTSQSQMVSKTKEAHHVLLEKGFVPENLRLETDPLGTHDSFFFSIRFIAAMKWLFGEACIQSDEPLR